ncbi:patatin-like phospholipase family protein [Fodinibius salsisoli]|uniref:Patatin-like phospholipase family protein n=1 Tax=Fodinibius salsisoli TaxID=2820877 RepID=A0ABT3PIS5_9BACT|nr:patatin-like phospholipase family protein [Fodinibius salsisoli]MCW9705822.1 patatin-like phospholipase family protein [Fodinibius salsisoli]
MSSKTFEIGLVMAGAVSAGAYTAGVIDFLLEALTVWEHAQKRGKKEAPPHKVEISVIAGASAGGMTGAILTAMVNDRFSPIRCLPERDPNPSEMQANKLYSSWVEQIDIADLLMARDLKQSDGKVNSLLDSTVLEEIADSAIQFNGNEERPDYIAEQLQLYLTLTNLQGVPYDINFRGGSGKGQTIKQHTDYFQFQLSLQEPASGETIWLNPGDDQAPGWKLLQNVALATGAFPGGLAPRFINRPFSHYNLRSWPIPQRPDSVDAMSSERCIEMRNIKPSWPAHNQQQFHYLSVDGGVMNNEPLELARRALANGQRNPREAHRVNKSVVMVDPFPSDNENALTSAEEIKDYDLVSVFGQLFGSLISQSRFKPDELMLANDDNVYSRFLIAPSRYTNGDVKAEYPIASGFFKGFGGFISRKFRKHDFQLGRRNCQRFLRKYFVLPLNDARQNPVFSNYSEEDFQRFSFMDNGQKKLPIIPLIGDLQEEERSLQWEDLKMAEDELGSLRSQVHYRSRKVIDCLLDQYVENNFSRKIAKVVARFKRKTIVDKIMSMVTEEMDDFGLK